MTIGSGLTINRPAKVKHLDDSIRAKIKFLTDDPDDLIITDLACTKGIDHDRHGTCNANCVSEFNFQLVRITCSNKILGYIACGICCAAVDLGAVFTGESSAAVTGIAAVGVDDNLTSCQTRVSVGTADNKASGRIAPG